MNTNRKTRSFSPLSLLLLINYIVAAGIVYLVYVSGGSPNIYSNLILIPIVLTSLYSPVWHSVLFSALSGLALGPLVEYLVNKDFGGALWVVRLIVYIALSIFISWISTNNRKKEQHFEYMATHDPLTGLPICHLRSSSATRSSRKPSAARVSLAGQTASSSAS